MLKQMMRSDYCRAGKLGQSGRGLRRLVALAGAVAGVALLAGELSATPLYWDTNGTATGSGNAGGAWNGSTADWNSDSNGGGTGSIIAVTTSADSVFFSAGTDQTSAAPVTLTGTQSALGITVQSTGGVALTGGTLSLNAGGFTINSGVGASSIASAVTINTAQTWTNNSTNALTVGGAIAINNAFTLAGGSFTFSTTNTGTGGLTLGAGSTLTISADGQLGGATTALTFDGGTLRVTSSVTGNSARPIALKAGGGTINLNSGVNFNYQGAWLGIGNLNINTGTTATGTLDFASSTGSNSFIGRVTIGSGTLSIGVGSVPCSTSIRGNAVTLSGGTLSTGAEGCIGEVSGSGGTLTDVATNREMNVYMYGDATFAGTVSATSQVDAAFTFIFRGNNTETFTGTVSKLGKPVAIYSNTGLTLAGSAALTASGTYASTAVNNGTLTLDDTSSNISRLLSGHIVAFNGGGTFSLLGNSAGTTQTLGQYTLTAGAATINVTNNGGTGAELTFGGAAPTRNSLATINFTNSGTGTLGAAGNNARIRFTNAPPLSNGILPYGTVNGADFATHDGNGGANGLSAYGGYTVGLPASGSTATVNYSESGAVMLTAGESVNSLKLVNTSGTSYGIDVGTSALTVPAILVPNTNSAPVIITGSAGGSLGNAGGELIVHVFGANPLTIAAPVTSGTITKTGDGALILNNPLGTNALSGITINQGVVEAAVDTGTGLKSGTTKISFRGGILALTGGTSAASPLSLTMGTGNGNVNWGTTTSTSGAAPGGGPVVGDSSDGGFAAMGSDQYVVIPGMTWDAATGYPSDGRALLLSSSSATAGIHFGNAGNGINLGASTMGANGSTGYDVRPFRVADNPATIADRAVIDGVISGSNPNTDLLKTGAGALELTQANTFNGNVIVTEGTLIASNNSALGAAAGGNNACLVLLGQRSGSTTAALLTNGNYTVSRGIVINDGGVGNAGGAVTIGGMSTSAASTFSGNITSLGTRPIALTAETGGNVTFSGIISGASPVNVGAAVANVGTSGTGTVILSNTNTYSGATSIEHGTLKLASTGGIARSASITIKSGATYDVSSVSGYTLASGQNLTGVGTVNGGLTVPASTALSAHVTAGTTGTLTFNSDLTLSNTSVLDLNFATGGSSGVSDAIHVGGNLTLIGTVTLNAAQTGSWTTGVYDFLDYSGSLLGTGNISASLSPSLPGSWTYSIDTSQANKILLVVTPPTQTVSWTGGDSRWDLSTSNWTAGSGPTTYNDPDRVIFDDSVGSGSTSVVIQNQTVAPTSITFGNTSLKSYTLGGTGSAAISGNTGLVVNGGGRVTLQSTVAYNYTGGTSVSTGSTLVVNGTIANSNVSVSGATLDGGGTINLALTSLGSSTIAVTSTLAVNGLTTVSGGTLTVAGALNGSGSIAVNSSAGLVVNGSTAGTKALTVNGSLSGTGHAGGAVTANDGAALSSAATLYLGSTLDLHGATSLTAGTVNVTGAAIIRSGAFTVSTGANLQAGGGLAIGANTLAGGGTVTGNATVAGGTINLSSTGVITGTLSSTGATTWANSGTVNGLVTISGDRFTVDTGKSISAADGIQVASGATLAGGGTISGGTVTVSGAIQPHVAASETKSLLVYSDMTLNSGATLNFNANGPSGPTDQIILAGGLTLDDGGNYTLNFNSVNNFYPSVQNYTLIATTNGVSGLGHWTVTGLPPGTLDSVIIDPNNSNDLLLAISSVPSPSKYFNGTASTWNNTASWSDDSGTTSPNPAAVPGALNTAIFNITTQNGAQTVNLDATQAARGLVFNSTGSVTINSGTGTNTLTIGDLGMSIASTAGTVAINPAVVLGASQTWTNNKTAAVTTIASTITGTTGQNCTLTLAGPGSTTLSSAISDPATSGTTALAINTGATVTLGGTNTYTGGTTVTAGILKANSTQPFGLGGPITIASGGAIDLNGKTLVAGSPSIVSVQGTGVSNSGALYNSNNTAAIYSGGIALAGPTTIGVAHDVTLSGPISQLSAGQTLTKTGGGTLSLTGTQPNTYTGLTTISGGTLRLQKSGGAVAFSGPVTIASGAQLLYGSGLTASDKQFSATVDLTIQAGGYSEGGNGLPSNFTENFGNVAVSGYGPGSNGAVWLSNNYTPTFNGVLTLTGAYIATPTGANNAYPTFKNGIVVNGSTATSYIAGSSSGQGGDVAMIFSGSQQTINVVGDGVSGPMATNGIDFDVEQNGFINWQGVGFTKTGVGTMKMGRIQNYNGQNTLGNITLSAGKLIMGGSNPLSPTTGMLVLNAGVLGTTSDNITFGSSNAVTVAATFADAEGVYGFDTTAGSMSFGPVTFNDAAGANRTFNVAANTLTVGNISAPNGAVSFTKAGGGMLAINAVTGSLTGNWTVSAGTLRVGAAGVVANAPQISIAGGATLDLSPLSNYTWGASQSLTTTGASGTTALVKGTVILAHNTDMHVTSVLSVAALNINTGVSARLAATASNKAVLTVNTLSPAGTGALDIEGNALVVKSSTYTAVKALMTSNNIVTTASDPAGNHSLQIMSGQDALANGNATGFAFAGGPAVASADVLVQYGWNGDLNMDGTVDYLDYGVIDNNYLSNPAPGAGSYAKGDLNGDGVINYLDYGIIDNAYLAANAPHAAAAASEAALSATAVPEPAAGVLLAAAAAVGLLARRRFMRRQ